MVPRSAPSLLFAIGLLCLDPACARSLPTTGPTPSAIPGAVARVEDSIESLDFCFTPDGALQLAWVLSLGRGSTGEVTLRQVQYQSFNSHTGVWRAPLALGHCEVGPVRIAGVGSMLHVVASGLLAHWVSGDSGHTWTTGTDLRGDSIVGATSFDAVSYRGSLILAYVTSRGAARRPRSESSIVLGVVRDSDPSGVSRQEFTLFRGEHSSPISPRLLSDGESLAIVYTLSYKALRSSSGETIASAKGPMQSRIFIMQSGDSGITWSQPREVGPIGTAEQAPVLQSSSWLVTDMEASAFEGDVLVYYCAGAFFCTRSLGPRDWTPPVRVAAPPADPSSPSYSALSPSAASNGNLGSLTWIDTRFHRSERSAQKPLGGLPWGDQPDWVNNDVFSLPLRAFPRKGKQGAPRLSPIRLTQDMSFTSVVKSRLYGDSVHVIWAGRAKVGRGKRDADEPPRIFHSVVPLE